MLAGRVDWLDAAEPYLRGRGGGAGGCDTGGLLRASWGLGSTADDLDRLATALDRLGVRL